MDNVGAQHSRFFVKLTRKPMSTIKVPRDVNSTSFRMCEHPDKPVLNGPTIEVLHDMNDSALINAHRTSHVQGTRPNTQLPFG